MYLGLFSGNLFLCSRTGSWLSSKNSLLSQAQSTHKITLTVTILKSFCLVGFLWASWTVTLAVLCLIIILELLDHIKDLDIEDIEDLELELELDIEDIEDLELDLELELELLDHIEDILELLNHLEALEL